MHMHEFFIRAYCRRINGRKFNQGNTLWLCIWRPRVMQVMHEQVVLRAQLEATWLKCTDDSQDRFLVSPCASGQACARPKRLRPFAERRATNGDAFRGAKGDSELVREAGVEALGPEAGGVDLEQGMSDIHGR